MGYDTLEWVSVEYWVVKKVGDFCQNVLFLSNIIISSKINFINSKGERAGGKGCFCPGAKFICGRDSMGFSRGFCVDQCLQLALGLICQIK